MTFQEFFNDLIDPDKGTAIVNEIIFSSLVFQVRQEVLKEVREKLAEINPKKTQ